MCSSSLSPILRQAPPEKKVYLKDGKVQLDATGGLPLVGVTWAPAAKGDEIVPVRLNG